MSMKREVIVIGAGLGGLSAAIRLSNAGFKVKVIEQMDTLGGKLQRVQLGPYLFDRGPSTITMRHHFERVFATVGKKMEDYVEFYPLQDGTRHYFRDGTRVDFQAGQLQQLQQQIASFASEDALQLPAFMAESKRLFELGERQFMNTLLLRNRDFLSPRMAWSFATAKPFTTLNELLRRYFRHPYTLALFGRYATYVGADPERAPAIFAMMPHVELVLGVQGVRGGTSNIVNGYAQLAQELGVEMMTGTRVEQIHSSNGRVNAVSTNTHTYPTNCVIANGDVLSICKDLIANDHRKSTMPNSTIEKYEPSLSGYVMLAGVSRQYDQLGHHTVYFPHEYPREFKDIFDKRRAAIEPTLYLCNSSASEKGMAPNGHSNLFILANAPYVTEQYKWQDHERDYRESLLEMMEVELELHQFRSAITQIQTYTPEQLMNDTSAYRGAIYGISSNSPKQTFFRPRNNSVLEGLWFVGGTTHPGGGTPLVTLSGQLVAEHLIRTMK